SCTCAGTDAARAADVAGHGPCSLRWRIPCARSARLRRDDPHPMSPSARRSFTIAFCLGWVAIATVASARRTVRLTGEVEEVVADAFVAGTSSVVHELRTRTTRRVRLVLPEHGPPLHTGMRVRLRGGLDEPAGVAPLLTVSGDLGGIEILADVAAPAAVA